MCTRIWCSKGNNFLFLLFKAAFAAVEVAVAAVAGLEAVVVVDLEAVEVVGALEGEEEVEDVDLEVCLFFSYISTDACLSWSWSECVVFLLAGGR